MLEHNHVPEMVQEIRRGKALAQLVEGAVVKDASGNVVELKNLRPDGTIGDPEAEAASRGRDRGGDSGRAGGAGRGRRADRGLRLAVDASVHDCALRR